mmetsp:Transcript_39241/g.70390  ORF Transcript_39241/g.70390 Transcript_39241/m.70390 type:complete len:255 (+) Transcript_39241:68-832(+)
MVWCVVHTCFHVLLELVVPIEGVSLDLGLGTRVQSWAPLPHKRQHVLQVVHDMACLLTEVAVAALRPWRAVLEHRRRACILTRGHIILPVPDHEDLCWSQAHDLAEVEDAIGGWLGLTPLPGSGECQIEAVMQCEPVQECLHGLVCTACQDRHPKPPLAALTQRLKAVRAQLHPLIALALHSIDGRLGILLLLPLQRLKPVQNVGGACSGSAGATVHFLEVDGPILRQRPVHVPHNALHLPGRCAEGPPVRPSG